MSKATGYKFLKYTLSIIFIFFAGVQYNDPDPIIWIPVYLVPIALVFYKKDKGLYFLIGCIYFLWAANQFPPEWEGLTLNEVGMKTINIELGRESLGLAFTGLVVWLMSFIK
jgi:hypothetical protein